MVNCQILEGDGRVRALRAARSIADQTVTELLVMHQNQQQMSMLLWTVVRNREQRLSVLGAGHAGRGTQAHPESKCPPSLPPLVFVILLLCCVVLCCVVLCCVEKIVNECVSSFNDRSVRLSSSISVLFSHDVYFDSMIV